MDVMEKIMATSKGTDKRITCERQRGPQQGGHTYRRHQHLQKQVAKGWLQTRACQQIITETWHE